MSFSQSSISESDVMNMTLEEGITRREGRREGGRERRKEEGRVAGRERGREREGGGSKRQRNFYKR